MTDWRQRTTDTYNRSAKELAEYFRSIGSRKRYIDIAFETAGNPANAKVVEIGCGDGRDAEEILKRTDDYVGIDVSGELIKLAKAQVPNAKFVVADAAAFNYPQKVDIVFAFASVLHLNKQELKLLLQKLNLSLKPGGIFYISTKYRAEYKQEVKEDKFGERMFYFYTTKLIAELAGDNYRVEKAWHETIGHTEWLEMILRKT